MYKRWSLGSLLVVGSILIITAAGVFTFASTAISHNASPGPRDAHNNPSTYWGVGNKAFATPMQAQTDSRAFVLGDSIALPNGLLFTVTKIQYNWQPSLAVSSTLGKNKAGDDPTGKQIVLVWFTATDKGAMTIPYNDYFFTLKVAGSNNEQRTAALVTVPSASYGSYNRTPWLMPGESTTTFLPYLIPANAQAVSFQYYMYPSRPHEQPATTYTVPQRLSVLLHSTGQSLRAAGQFSFKGDTSLTVQ